VYLCHKVGKYMWDAMNADYRGSDARTELYIIEQYLDYKMVDRKNMIDQDHEI
jgi:hypothetical protein